MPVIIMQQVRDIRNQMFHPANFEMTNDEVTNCLHTLQEMIIHIAPLQGATKNIFDKIGQVQLTIFEKKAIWLSLTVYIHCKR